MVDEPGYLTHLDHEGHARMVDVGAKDETARFARARGVLRLSQGTADRLLSGDTPKGDVLATARVAGIQAAKRTSELIPLCHVVRLSSCRVELTVERDRIVIEATVKAQDRTGVEMEALTAASVCALTLYDMLKAIDKQMVVDSLQLLEKTGGRSGDYRLDP